MLTAAVLTAFAVLLVALAANYAIVFPRQPYKGPTPPLSIEERGLVPRLKAHVRAVASRPHNLDHYADLLASAAYIEDTLKAFGFTPTSQVYKVGKRKVRNIEVILGPPLPASVRATFVIGAHYDSPDDSPGANDNGTGVAALLELARLARAWNLQRNRLRLVFFVNEEQPYGKTPDMGSWRHAKLMKEIGERVAGMISLETLGYFSEEPGSQAFPFPLGYLFPDRGNFVAFVGLPGSRALLGRLIRSFRSHVPFASIGGVGPGFIPGFDLSDHWAYAQFGFPALMITDTAPYRNPRYHEPTDTPDTVDYRSLARITLGLSKTIRALAE